jgi:endoglucanase
MRIDFGAKNREEAEKLGVKRGVVCTPYVDLTHLGTKESDLIIGPAFDDIGGVVGLIEAMEILSNEPPKNLKIHFVATVQEEIGLRGAIISAYNIKPWIGIATDVDFAYQYGVTENKHGGIEIGKGPAITIGPNFTRALWEIIEKEAIANEIPYQILTAPRPSGVDSVAIQVARGGSISGIIKLANRYMHSPNEVVSLSDIRNLGKLIAATLRALDKSDLKHTVEVFRK